jgi:hypothetical protein
MYFKGGYLDLVWIIPLKSFNLNVMMIMPYFESCYKHNYNNIF